MIQKKLPMIGLWYSIIIPYDRDKYFLEILPKNIS